MVQFKAQAAELLDAQRASKMKMISHGGEVRWRSRGRWGC